MDEVYPQPRAVHLDDEIFRIVARLGVADEFAAISRPALGLRLLDRSMKVLAEFTRDTRAEPQRLSPGQHVRPAGTRSAAAHQPQALPAAPNCAATSRSPTSSRRATAACRVTYPTAPTAASTSSKPTTCWAATAPTASRAPESARRMEDLGFEQRWLVVDVATVADLDQWEGVHQVCDPVRAGTYMRIGETRYRWEFRLLDRRDAPHDFDTLDALRPLIGRGSSGRRRRARTGARHRVHVPRATRRPLAARADIFLLGDAAHLTPPFIGQGMGAGLRDAMNLAWKLAGVLDGDLARDRARKPTSRSENPMPADDPACARSRRAMTAGGEFGDLIRRVLVPAAPVARHECQDPRQSDPGVAPVGVGAQDRDSAAAGGHAVPESPGRRGTPARRRPRQRLRDRHHGAARRCAAVCSATRATPWSTSPLPTANSPSGCAAGTSPSAIVRPDRTVMCSGRDMREICAALPTFSPDKRMRSNV